MVVRLSALSTGLLYPRKFSWYSFLLEAGMVLTRENQVTRREICLSVFSPTENLTLDDVGSNQSLRIESPATNRLNRGTELRNQIKFNYICNPLT